MVINNRRQISYIVWEYGNSAAFPRIECRDCVNTSKNLNKFSKGVVILDLWPSETNLKEKQTLENWKNNSLVRVATMSPVNLAYKKTGRDRDNTCWLMLQAVLCFLSFAGNFCGSPPFSPELLSVRK